MKFRHTCKISSEMTASRSLSIFELLTQQSHRVLSRLYLAIPNPQASKKSLNQRFRPDLVHTKTIFSMDDDLQFNCESLEFAFKTASMFPERLVGFYPRLHTSKDGLLEYRARTAEGEYSMVLTNACFINIKWLEAYHSDHKTAQFIRNLVFLVFLTKRWIQGSMEKISQ
jgi:hypothetical protein